MMDVCCGNATDVDDKDSFSNVLLLDSSASSHCFRDWIRSGESAVGGPLFASAASALDSVVVNVVDRTGRHSLAAVFGVYVCGIRTLRFTPIADHTRRGAVCGRHRTSPSKLLQKIISLSPFAGRAVAFTPAQSSMRAGNVGGPTTHRAFCSPMERR